MLVTAKCKKCGEGEVRFRSVNGSGVCPVCGETVSLKTADPATYAEQKKLAGEVKAEFDKIAGGYKETGSTKDVVKCVQGYSGYKDKICDEEFFALWRNFILEVAGVAAERGEKKDKELQIQLKSAAKTYDVDNPEEGKSLYADIIRAYPNLGTDNDWNDMIQTTQGDKNKFSALSDTLINYIIKARDKAFAMDRFAFFAAKGEEWADSGAIYLRALFNNEEIAENVFNVSSFTPKTKKFMRNAQAYCNKCLNKENGITLSETKVWAKYETACKRQRRRNIIIISSVLAAVAAVSLALFFFFNSVNSESVSFNIDKKIEVTYGEEIDLSDYTVSYKKRSGEAVTEPVTMKMFRGFDPEKVNTQQTVTVEFSGKSVEIVVIVNSATLAQPVLTRSGNNITWQSVPHAQDYGVYINNQTTAVATVSEEARSYDLSEFAASGQLSVWVKANRPNEKYNDSRMSETFTATKLAAPMDLTYGSGTLSWGAVDGADGGYELNVNGEPLRSTSNSISVTLNLGDNDVTVRAKSADGEAIDGKTSQTLYLHSSISVDSVEFKNGEISWQAEEKANQFDVYVDGSLWKTLNRKSINLADDNFTSEKGDGEHTIGIVCKSNTVGAQPSEKAEFGVSIGNNAEVREGTLKWEQISGSAVTYVVTIAGGEPERLTTPSIALASKTWKVGANDVSVTAEVTDGGTTKKVFLESATVTKLASPTLAVSGGNWVSDTDEYNRYRIQQSGSGTGSGSWEATLKPTSEFEAGDYTVYAKRVVSSAIALEVESDEVSVTLRKLATPAISMENHKVTAGSSADLTKYVLSLESSQSEHDGYSPLGSLDDIHTAGTYYVRAKLSAPNGEEGFDLVLDSEVSNSVSVIKLAAPEMVYSNGDLKITAKSGKNVHFYYLDENGKEQELPQGTVDFLPQGIFEVYGRDIAIEANELDSENTIKEKRATVFNMSIRAEVRTYSSTQIMLTFTGCSSIDELTFDYQINVYKVGSSAEDRILVGHSSKQVDKNIPNTDKKDRIYMTITYPGLLTYESGYSLKDIQIIEVIYTVKSGTNQQTLTATCNNTY